MDTHLRVDKDLKDRAKQRIRLLRDNGIPAPYLRDLVNDALRRYLEFTDPTAYALETMGEEVSHVDHQQN